MRRGFRAYPVINCGRLLILAAWAVCVFSVAQVGTGAAAGEVAWQPLDIHAAMQKAQAEGKLLYVFVEGDNCPPCDAFKATHLTDPAFVDFVNTLYVPLRAHESDPAGRAFLESLKLLHPAVPRFYVMSPAGQGVSMSVGMVAAPPMGAVDVLKLAFGRIPPVNAAAAAALAGRIRAHAAAERAAGTIHPDNPLRDLGLAVLEAGAWALSGRLDEAERAWGGTWAERLVDQDVRGMYINFWIKWGANLTGALRAAEIFRATSPGDPAGALYLASALAANGRYADAVREGEALLAADPNNAAMRQMVEQWRGLAAQ